MVGGRGIAPAGSGCDAIQTPRLRNRKIHLARRIVRVRRTTPTIDSRWIRSGSAPNGTARRQTA